MSYQGYLISNYATGYDKALQPWLLPDDAFQELFDGYVYKGVLNKREGYSGYANGLKSIYCESRMVHNVLNAAMTGAINGVNRTFTINATPPLRRGTFTVNGSNPVQTATDNGVGGFTGDATGTINYTTGAVSITWTLAPIALSTVTATYDYHPGNPVMGVMNFYPSDNNRKMIVADTQYVNIYNASTDRLEDISPAVAYTGLNNDFWSWVNYPTAADAPRLLFANRADNIQSFDGTTVTTYMPTFGGGANPLKCRQLFNVRDRLVLFQTVEGGTLYPRRIRISGFGANCDNFDNTAPGAGFIDIPDNTWFYGAAFNRDDILFFTEAATWMLKYTNNDVTPFVLEKLDPSRGSRAAFSVITYLNRTMAASPRGLVISDGYSVERMDYNLPEFTFNEINNDKFENCFSGFLDEDRDVYLIYPSIGDVRPPLLTASQSDRILTINFEEDNYSIYRLPLSCMGNFILSFDILWSDLTAANGFPNWDTLAEKYDSWNAFPYTKGVPVGIGGGHKGEVWNLNDNQSEDNPQKIRAVTIVDDTTLRIETDWNNYNIGDYIVLESLGGMVEANDKQAAIKAINVNYRTFDLEFDTTTLSAYTTGGIASRVTPFECLTKKFNPYTNLDKKVRCGWLYMYVSSTGTDLTDIDGVDVPAFLNIDVITNDNEIDTKPTFTYQIDCTNTPLEIGSKRWVKIWINQTAKFVQFRLHNTQAGAKIKVHAMMPGFQPVGRLV